MKITFYGHASLGIEVGGKHIIVDPFITGNPQAAAIDINTLKADYILLTHAHGDHVLDVEAIANRTNAVIVSNAEITSHYAKQGLNAHPMNHGGSWNFDFGKVKEGDTVFTITSGGCNTLGFLRFNPTAVHCVDINPAQNHLMELKKAAFK